MKFIPLVQQLSFQIHINRPRIYGCPYSSQLLTVGLRQLKQTIICSYYKIESV